MALFSVYLHPCEPNSHSPLPPLCIPYAPPHTPAITPEERNTGLYKEWPGHLPAPPPLHQDPRSCSQQDKSKGNLLMCDNERESFSCVERRRGFRVRPFFKREKMSCLHSANANKNTCRHVQRYLVSTGAATASSAAVAPLDFFGRFFVDTPGSSTVTTQPACSRTVGSIIGQCQDA